MCAAWALSALWSTASPARADAVKTQALTCMQPSADTETRIMMCSLAIMSGRLDGKGLAALYFYRGSAYADRKDHRRAIEDFDQAIKLSPTFEDAKRARQRSMAAVAPSSPPVQRNAPRTGLDLSDVSLHAKACVRNKVHPDAFGGDMGVEFCSSAIRSGRWSGRNLAALYYARGARYFRQQRYAAAIPDFDQAIRLNPAFAQAYTGRCAANAATGKLDRAVADCDRALQLNPKDAQARKLRARLNR